MTAFAGFSSTFVALPSSAEGVRLFVRRAGAGEPVLLLHGYPQTHHMWRHLAPGLAERFDVVVPDVKGYGASDAPAPLADASNYSKRSLAADCIALMRSLGHSRFAVVGHDRGARIGYRMALDHPEVVTRLVTLDIIPTGAMWEATSKTSAVTGFHWGFLAQAGGMPERLIGADPAYFARYLIERWTPNADRIGAEAMEVYARAFSRPEVIAATCADYRAGATLDDEHDQADLARGHKIRAPVLAIWSERLTTQRQSKATDPLATWRRFAERVEGFSVPSGHFIAEEVPDAVAEPIAAFLSSPGSDLATRGARA